MDAVIFVSICIVVTLLFNKPTEELPVVEEIVVEDVSRETKLNESFYEDEQAFTYITRSLGFPRS